MSRSTFSTPVAAPDEPPEDDPAPRDAAGEAEEEADPVRLLLRLAPGALGRVLGGGTQPVDLVLRL
ncbi:hypothetical protein JHN52_22155, partial [Streptomyces sp. MBT97]|uniref:hypothetical protein n=1 Tax=Streptomyces sp. MBT97 TaxID=2800411 RepID=UPI00190C20F8